jgi:hypothetical protein
MITDDNELFEFDSPQARREMNRRHAAIAKQMQAIAIHALRELQQKIEAGQPLDISAEDARRMYADGLKMEREAKENDEPIPPATARKPH